MQVPIIYREYANFTSPHKVFFRIDKNQPSETNTYIHVSQQLYISISISVRTKWDIFARLVCSEVSELFKGAGSGLDKQTNKQTTNQSKKSDDV